MTIKRIKDFPTLERHLLKLMFEQIRHKYKYGQWHEFKGKLKIKDRLYQLQCLFLLTNDFLTIKKSSIIDPQSRIILPASATVN